MSTNLDTIPGSILVQSRTSRPDNAVRSRRSITQPNISESGHDCISNKQPYLQYLRREIESQNPEKKCGVYNDLRIRYLLMSPGVIPAWMLTIEEIKFSARQEGLWSTRGIELRKEWMKRQSIILNEQGVISGVKAVPHEYTDKKFFKAVMDISNEQLRYQYIENYFIDSMMLDNSHI